MPDQPSARVLGEVEVLEDSLVLGQLLGQLGLQNGVRGPVAGRQDVYAHVQAWRTLGPRRSLFQAEHKEASGNGDMGKQEVELVRDF